MTDRETQAFRAVYSRVEQQVPEAPEWEQIKAPQIRLTSEAAPRRRPALVALGAALGAFLLVGGTIFGIRLVADGGEGDFAGPATTEAGPGTTAADVTATTGAGGILPAAADLAEGWLRLDPAITGLGPDRMVGNVVAAGDGFIAAGSDATYSRSDGPGVVYHSANGVSWSESVLAAPGRGAPEGGVLHATSLGYLIAGSFWQPTAEGGVHGPGDGYTTLEIGVWHSVDGGAWTWVPLAVFEYGLEGVSHDYSLSEIVETDRGLLLLVNHQIEGASAEVLVCTSGDGLTWEQAAAPDIFSDSGIVSLAAGSDRFVAMGWGPAGMVAPRVWVSEDGLAWEWLPDALPPGFVPYQVVSGGPGFVALASTAVGGMILTSVDGLSWSAAEVDDPEIEILGIAPLADGLVATGWDEIDGVLGPVLWLSSDGRAWERVIVDPAVFAATANPEAADDGEIVMEPVYIDSLFPAGDRLVAVGTYTTGEGYEAGAVWIWSPISG